MAAGGTGVLVGVLKLHSRQQIVVVGAGAVFLLIGLIFVFTAVSERWVFRRGLTSLVLRHEWTYPLLCCTGCSCVWYTTESYALDRDGRVPVLRGAQGTAGDPDVFVQCADAARTRVNVTAEEGFLGLCAPDKGVIANDISNWLRLYGRGGGHSSGERRSHSRNSRGAAAVAEHEAIHIDEA